MRCLSVVLEIIRDLSSGWQNGAHNCIRGAFKRVGHSKQKELYGYYTRRINYISLHKERSSPENILTLRVKK